jgi:hypothetical protein
VVQQIIDKKTYLARIFVGVLIMFFVMVPALSAMCVSPQSGFPAVVAADSTMLTLSANVTAKDCCLKNKIHLPLDKWTQNCGWTTSLFFPDILKPSGFETQSVHFSLTVSSSLILGKGKQEFRSSSRNSLSKTGNSPLFAQKTALLI